MIPALAALGFGAVGIGNLIRDIYRANTDPDPKEIESAIDNKAINISRQNGIPVDQVKQQIREDTIKELKADREFKLGDAALNVLMAAPGVGVAGGALRAAKGAKSLAEGMTAAKGAMGAMGGMEAATGGLYKGKPAAKTAGTTVKNSEKVAEESAEMANPAMRAAHGAEEMGEYGLMIPERIRPLPGGPVVGSGPTMYMGNAQPRLTMDAPNATLVGDSYSVIAPPYQATRGLPLNLGEYQDAEMIRQLRARMATRFGD
jgi:hypothetical protein